MIPQGKYDPKLADNLRWYLIQELRRTMSDRGELEAQWIHWEEVYRARPAEKRKDFPFVGASNLVIPVMAADTDVLYARMMGLLLDPPNLWSIEPLRPEMTEFARATEDFLSWAQKNELNLNRPVGNWLIELHKLGTGVLKQRYVREMKKVYEWRELQQGTFQQQAVILLKDHPEVNHVRLHDFYIPAGFPTIQQAPWTAERVRMDWPRFMNRVKAGVYTNADQVGSYYFSPPINQVQRALDRISNYAASRNQQLEFYEFWLDFDIDGDGWDEALVCTIHLESQSYVRLDFNPFFNQDKPYSSAPFMPDVNSFYGIGLGEMLDQFQEEITAMHNQRIDNGTVTNSSMFAIRKDNTNIRQTEPIYPGKIWRLNDPKSDLVRLPMGDGGTLASSLENENATREEAAKRDGVNDYVTGNNQPNIGYGTAYTTQQMQLNSSKRFAETLRAVRDALSESGTRVLELYQQFNQRGKPYVALGQGEGQLVDAVLQFPLDLIRKGLRVNVTAVDANNSKDAQIRTTTLVMQQLMQFYQTYMQMLSYAGNPQMPPPIQQTALKAAQGSAVLMERLLELYGIQDIDRMMPELENAASEQQRALSQIQQLLSIGPGAGAPQAALPPAGMGGPVQQGPPPIGQPVMGGPAPQLGPGNALQSTGSASSVR